MLLKKSWMPLGLDLSNDSLRETPTRVAKMYLNEIFEDSTKISLLCWNRSKIVMDTKEWWLKKTSPFKVTANTTSFQSWVVRYRLHSWRQGTRIKQIEPYSASLRPPSTSSGTLDHAGRRYAQWNSANRWCGSHTGSTSPHGRCAEFATEVLKPAPWCWRGRFEKELKEDFFRQLNWNFLRMLKGRHCNFSKNVPTCLFGYKPQILVRMNRHRMITVSH